MISQEDLESYEFETIENYFEFIIESKNNGQFTQVLNLVKHLSQNQHNKFLLWHLHQNHNTILNKAYLKWR